MAAEPGLLSVLNITMSSTGPHAPVMSISSQPKLVELVVPVGPAAKALLPKGKSRVIVFQFEFDVFGLPLSQIRRHIMLYQASPNTMSPSEVIRTVLG